MTRRVGSVEGSTTVGSQAAAWWMVALALISVPMTVSAQDATADAATTTEYQPTLEEEMASAEGNEAPRGVTTLDAGHQLSDEQAALEEDEDTGPRRSDTDPRELPDTDYFFVGALARALIVPDFIQSVFAEYRGGTPINGGGGAYFNWRRNGFNVLAEVWYGGFGNEGYYRGIGAAETETEQVVSTLGVVFGNFVFGWGIDVTDFFAVELGFGLGFGAMTGNLVRNEARPDGAGGYTPCTGINDPSSPQYCGDPRGVEDLHSTPTRPGATYQTSQQANPFRFGESAVPPVFFWLDLPRVGLRFKPIRQVQIRIDGGYNLYGFNVGGSIGYGF